MTEVTTFIFGLIFGSFITALVWRIQAREELRTKGKRSSNKPKVRSRKQSSQRLSIVSGRSMCPACRHTLHAWDLVPVLSWLLLQGKCRYCGKRISWQYPLIELVTGTSFVASYIYWPRELAGTFEWLLFAIWLASVVCFVSLAVYDARRMMLPDKLMQPLLIISLVSLIPVVSVDGIEALRDRLYGVAIAFGFFYLLAWMSKGKWIGGGDIKFGIVMGLWLGAVKSIVALLLAFYSAAVIVLPLLAVGKVTKKSRIAFGPFLIVATFMSQLFGQEIFDWYTSLIF